MQHPTVLSQALALFTPIHHDGYKFVVPAAVATVVLFLIWSPLGLIAAFVTAALAFFFRDPPRVTPVRDGLIVSPADGVVLSTGLSTPPAELGLGAGPMPALSIFLSLLDVHVVRSPYAGRISQSVHTLGAFNNAASPGAQAENERHGFIVDTDDGARIGLVLIAGAVARRIVTGIRVDDRVKTGERVGVIRFGSRVDIYLPSETAFLVTEGQKMVAGETLIADLSHALSLPAFKLQ